jgi:hypothetical protein
MQIHVVVEPAAGSGYVARTGMPYNCDAHGATEDEAVENLKQRVAAAKVIALDVPDGANPWVALAGYMKDDPMWEVWRKAIEENREREANEPERPW